MQIILKLASSYVDRFTMTKANFEESFEIYLFTGKESENIFSKLSEFISFLKYNRINLPYKFSYVSREDSLISKLTLNENILMDFNSKSLTAKKEFQFQKFLKEQDNRNLESLYHKIDFPHIRPDNSTLEMRKLSSLVKALIFEGQFIFLESPEKNIDEESLNIFIKALKHHVEKHKMNVFIFSEQLDLWAPHVHHHVKREIDYSFGIYKMNTNQKWDREREAFYADTPEGTDSATFDNKEEDLENKLIFHLPKKTQVKKIAA